MKYYIIALFGLLLSIASFSQEVSATLDHDQIKIGEQTHVDLEVRFPAAYETVIMPELKDTLAKFVEILNVSKVDTAFDEDDIGLKIYTQRITITSFDSGLHVIPPFLIRVGDQQLSTDPLLLTVNTIPIEAEQDIKDIKNIIDVPFSLWDWILSNRIIVGIILLFLLIAVGVALLIKKLRNKPLKEFQMIIPKDAADALALKKLKELESQKLWQNNKVKEFQSALSFITREYIENRFEVRALEMTTEEILTALSLLQEVSEEQKSKLHHLLMAADMAKFAKQLPVASENETAFKTAQSFIQETKYVEQVSEVEPQNEENKA